MRKGGRGKSMALQAWPEPTVEIRSCVGVPCFSGLRTLSPLASTHTRSLLQIHSSCACGMRGWVIRFWRLWTGCTEEDGPVARAAGLDRKDGRRTGDVCFSAYLGWRLVRVYWNGREG